jgi:hypothetical protein
MGLCDDEALKIVAHGAQDEPDLSIGARVQEVAEVSEAIKPRRHHAKSR